MEPLEPFDEKYLQDIVRWVKPLWTMVDWREGFKSLDVEFIVRHNIFKNDFAFQLTDGHNLLAVAFAAKRTEENDAAQWLSSQLEELTVEEKSSLQLVADYLEEMDKRTCSFMAESDIRLTLFASSVAGFGGKILRELEKLLKTRGFKTMYLWTDSDCNHQWYPRHGFTLVESAAYETFSTAEKNFMTYIFRKEL